MKFKKTKEHKARDKTIGIEISEDWNNNVLPITNKVNKKYSKVVKEWFSEQGYLVLRKSV